MPTQTPEQTAAMLRWEQQREDCFARIDKLTDRVDKLTRAGDALAEACRAYMEPMRRYTEHSTWTKGDEDLLIEAYNQARAALAEWEKLLAASPQRG